MRYISTDAWNELKLNEWINKDQVNENSFELYNVFINGYVCMSVFRCQSITRTLISRAFSIFCIFSFPTMLVHTPKPPYTDYEREREREWEIAMRLCKHVRDFSICKVYESFRSTDLLPVNQKDDEEKEDEYEQIDALNWFQLYCC